MNQTRKQKKKNGNKGARKADLRPASLEAKNKGVEEENQGTKEGKPKEGRKEGMKQERKERRRVAEEGRKEVRQAGKQEGSQAGKKEVRQAEKKQRKDGRKERS